MARPESETARRALSIAAALAAADPGDKADARRMDEGGSALFWRQIVRLDIPPSAEASWRQFTRLVALLTPAGCSTSIHDPDLGLGGALARAGLSEARFARLLAARGAAREAALERTIRMTARSVTGFDVVDLAVAILWPSDTRRLARDFYRHLDHQSPEESRDA